MLKAKLDDGTEVLVDPDNFEQFERQYGHRLVSQKSTLPRGATEAELAALQALTEAAPEEFPQGLPTQQ